VGKGDSHFGDSHRTLRAIGVFMNKRIFLSAIPVMVLVFGMTVIGCENEPSDKWSNVTSLSQVNGSWKALSSYGATTQGMKFSGTTNNYIITFNAGAQTMSSSGSTTVTISGGNIDENWSSLKTGLVFLNQQDGITVNFDDAKHSYTLTYNNFSIPLTNQQLPQMGIQINQDGSKLKMADQGIEIIYTKQK
jgi:hypothetical protein